MRRMAQWVCRLLLIVLAPLLLVLNGRAYQPGGRPEALAQLRFLEQRLAKGGAEQMQALFPEGYLFTWALYGLTAAELAKSVSPTDPLRIALLHRSRTAIQRIASPTGRAPFDPDLTPPDGAFYNGWSLYLRAEYFRAAGELAADSSLRRGFEHDCAALAQALTAGKTPFLPSYSGAAWPADGVMGVAALAIYDRLGKPRFGPVIQQWVRQARARLDPQLQGLPHAVDAATGFPISGVRGESLALMCRVLPAVDSVLAREQYEVLRRHFVTIRWGVPGVLEYPVGQEGAADIDSGPLLFGFSGPALVVGAAAARAQGDHALAAALLSVIEVAGMPVTWQGKRCYAGGAVPVGDAFIAWANATAEPVTVLAWPPLIPGYWRWPWHLFSGLLLAGLLWGAGIGRRRP